jgi:hypothetical protein
MKNSFMVAIATLAFSLTACGGEDEATTFSNERIVKVEASLTLAQHIHQGGLGFGANDDLTSIKGAFRTEPASADYDAKFVLVRFNRLTTTETTLLEFRNYNLRPANTAECLAYGAAVNQARRFDLKPPSYRMICLGSNPIHRQTHNFLSVSGWGDRMVVARVAQTTDHYNYDWGSDTVFLAIRP